MIRSNTIIGFKVKIVTIIFFIGIGSNVLAQTTEVLPSLITEETVLQGGVYIVESNVKIAREATLIIWNGATIKVKSGAKIVVEGGLSIVGTADNLINVTSFDIEEEGYGFEIAKVDLSDIKITYARFSNLLLPLNFVNNWSRVNAIVENNIFTENNSEESSIIIQQPDMLRGSHKIDFVFRNNIFVNNYSNIYIEELQSDRLNLNFSNNVIFGNYYAGYERGGIFNSPLYVVLNDINREYEAVLENNSIFNNYLIDNLFDTIISEVNLGITGIIGNYNISSNYFGSDDKDVILQSFDHFQNNNHLPLLDPVPFLNKPSEKAQTHVWKVLLSGNVFDWSTKFEGAGQNTIHLFFNRDIPHIKTFKVSYIYFDLENNLLVETDIDESYISFNDKPEERLIYIQANSYIEKEAGYIRIYDMYDSSGFPIPDVTIGKNNVNKYISENVSLEHAGEMYIVSRLEFDSLIAIAGQAKISDSIVSKYVRPVSKDWEIGLQGGKSFYYGEIQETLGFKSLRNTLGILVRYNINPRWALKFNLNSVRVYANDRDNVERLRERRLSFENDIYEFSTQLELNLVPANISNYMIPGISTGLVVFYHNPYSPAPSAQKYELREIGTAGEKNAYSRFQLAIPFDIDFKWIMASNWSFGLNFGLRKTFTDYIDDVGYDNWVSQDDLNAANPGLYGRAGQLGNPANYTEGKRGSQAKDWYFVITISMSKLLR